MARYAMIHSASGMVANVIEWDGDTANWQPPDGYDMVEDSEGKAGPGFQYDKDTSVFTPPPGGEPGTGV
jgi:hypothetical protein